MATLNARLNLAPFIKFEAADGTFAEAGQQAQTQAGTPPISDMSENWHANHSNRVHLQGSNKHYWLKVALTNSESDSKTIVLSFEYAPILLLSLYEHDPASGNTQQLLDQLGLLKPFSARPIGYRYLAREIVLPAGATREYYWDAYLSNPIYVQISAWDPVAFNEDRQNEQIIFGVVYGMLIMLTIYNLFVFFTTREKAHLCFVLLSALTIPLVSSIEGHLYQLIAPNHDWPKWQLLLGFLATQQPALALFTSYYLNLRERMPIFYRGFIVFAVGSMLLWCYVLLEANNQTALRLAAACSGMVFLSATFVAIYLSIKGTDTARYYVLSVFVCILALLAVRVGYPVDLMTHTIKIMPLTCGYLTMIFMFSIALGNRIKHIQEEKIAASLALAKLTEDKLKSNVELYKSKVQQMELEQRADEAKIESRAKSEFLAAMSHEIRTPMSGVLGMTELLRDTELSSTQERYVSTIYSSGQALLNVINDLLDYSKIEAGKMQLETVTFNLDELLDDCISIFALKATEKNIDFIGSIKPGTENFLKGDPTKLRQIILNLLSNAFKFTEAGNITIYAYPTSKTSINSIELRFDIKDTGIGLSESEQQSLFDPFSQADLSTSRKYGGTGLGLAICKQLAELMNGSIGVNSAPGQGSTFWFTARLLIPQRDERPASETIHPALAGKRILICDEHPAFLDACLIITSTWDMRVTVSSSARDTLQQLKDSIHEAHSIDFLLAPINLQLDNKSIFIHAAKYFKDVPNGQRPYFIATTTATRLDRELADKYSLANGLSKPLTKKLLKECLLHCLGIEEVQAAPLAERPVYNFDHLNVLVAEDNKVNAMVIEGLLQKLRIYPQTVENGAKALESITLHDSTKPYDLIFMDCEMPIMDGYEATQKIRELEAQHKLQAVVIVGLSAHASIEYQQKALEAGMDDYITKPVNKGDIENVFRKYFSDRGNISQLPVAG